MCIEDIRGKAAGLFYHSKLIIFGIMQCTESTMASKWHYRVPVFRVRSRTVSLRLAALLHANATAGAHFLFLTGGFFGISGCSAVETLSAPSLSSAANLPALLVSKPRASAGIRF